MVRPIKILITVFLVAYWLVACSNFDSKAQVIDRRPPPGEKVKFHIVSKGETLYSIAWRYNLNYRLLARANGVGSDYSIFPGQKLTLNTSYRPPVPPRTADKTPSKTISTTKVPTNERSSRSIKRSPVAPKETQNTIKTVPLRWSWPARGKLIATFSSNGGLNKGIDIQGKLGEPVYTAAAGSVVYSGSGLRGYGKLIIVKHSEKYLSAYAHNRRLFVKEGQKVEAGEKIAEMGSSGSDTVKLHFEIRYNGKPMDPQKLLPRK